MNKESYNMSTLLRTNQALQIRSFWNLIQASDENVQRELQRLLNTKYASLREKQSSERSSFFSLKGTLASKGSEAKDKRLLDQYLEEKYDL
jgi:hypothetical protein